MTGPLTLARPALLCSLGLIAACTPTPPPAPPPVAPPRLIVPPRPLPPMGAAPNLVLPPLGADGRRVTVNSGISLKQAAWNLRSAYNVAALNCQAPAYQAMAANYADFLKSNKKTLAAIYKDLDKQFKQTYGKTYIQQREVFQTQVYNYFAFPPVMPVLCDNMLAIGEDLRTVPSKELETRSVLELAKLENIYQSFFAAYQKYQGDLATWNATYAPPAPLALYPAVPAGPGGTIATP
ncbi:MAG: hypothetical protein LKF30_08095 [Sphingobium sp.]|jgi:hypothetical protein|nr:hypothetical protein [Sphingobium sp.]MCI1270880.1 hypothetical protein [Sphingobium sp.]MCI1755777.1 hypothetical protein [Sphingobium sp.]MCI2053081.1 hypothetical protein [Sphingobium sp.]